MRTLFFRRATWSLSYIASKPCHFHSLGLQYIPYRAFLIDEPEEHQKTFLPRKSHGNKHKYRDIYNTKQRTKESRSFWRSYSRIASAIFLSIVAMASSGLATYHFYHEYLFKGKSNKYITEKLAQTQSDQQLLNRVATELANEYIIPQMNRPLVHDMDLNTQLRHIPRTQRSISKMTAAIADEIYQPSGSSWHLLQGVPGCAISSTLQDAYNSVLHDIELVLRGESDKYPTEEVEHRQYLYLNFQEIDHAQNALENLIKYHWRRSDFESDAYNELPADMDQFDLLRKALLIAINEQYAKNMKHKQRIVLVIDSLDELIFKDPDFKYWLTLLAGAVRQRMVSIVSVSCNLMASLLIADLVHATYGGIVHYDDESLMANIRFFDEHEIREILQLNLQNNSDNKRQEHEALAHQIHQVSLGYPLLVSAIVAALKEQTLAPTDIVKDPEDGSTFLLWFDEWYEQVYFARYVAPAIRVFKSESMAQSESALNSEVRKMLQKCRAQIIGQFTTDADPFKPLSTNPQAEDRDDLSSVTAALEMMQIQHVEGLGVIFPPNVAAKHGFKYTLPIIASYWNRHSVEDIQHVLEHKVFIRRDF